MQNDNQKPQSGKKKGSDLTFKQLCWNCKRATCPDGLYCPWAAEGKPIDNWTATIGNGYRVMKYGAEIDLGNSYKITSCPLFVKDREFTNKREVVKEVADKLNLKEVTVYHEFSKYIKKYEKVTNKQLPAWVKE